MTDKKDTKPSNVKPLFEGIKIDQEEDKLEPIPSVVSALEMLLAEAKEGTLRELCFVSVYADETCKRAVQGEPYNFTLMQCNLDVLRQDYFDMATYPFLVGVYQEYSED
jgi:hypothetical protein